MPKAKPATLADRLRSLRSAAGLSQSQLAEAAGVPVDTLQNLEQGRRTDPQSSTLAALARALNVTMEELLGGER